MVRGRRQKLNIKLVGNKGSYLLRTFDLKKYIDCINYKKRGRVSTIANSPSITQRGFPISHFQIICTRMLDLVSHNFYYRVIAHNENLNSFISLLFFATKEWTS